MSKHFRFFLLSALLLLASSMASAATVEHSFTVQNLNIQRLCNQQVITAVNGQFPGPTLLVREGDTLVIHVTNNSPHNITIHWHGVFQMLTAWADGPSMVTQCPIVRGQTYTYRFQIIKQEGTLWWHAHISALRATVHGALIIRPRLGRSYPFPTPNGEVPILLGEWYNTSIVDIENQALATGGIPQLSNAFTINGLPGDLYECSQNQMYRLKVERGRTYLLRIINVALDNQFFFKIANHSLRVVGIDANYIIPYSTDVVAIASGQTVDVLFVANQQVGSYYIVASPYVSASGASLNTTTTRGIITYDGAASTTPIMPLMPVPNDTPTAFKFYSNLIGLVSGPHWVPVPRNIDENMFITFGLGLAPCGGNAVCGGLFNQRLSASMNNMSFELPKSLSMLQAYVSNVGSTYTTDFPNNPPIQFDYTSSEVRVNQALLFAPKSTSVKVLEYNSTVQIVLQNTNLLGAESHPMHLHGFDFHVLAQGFGNYDPVNDPQKFNLVNPQLRNTIATPVRGWAVIRFTANNPGVWFMHCHMDTHMAWGLGMVFIVKNGPTPSTTLPPPPRDLPQC